ncbi:FAD-dependent oxidoreductase [Saccharopolyspora taberi]|uniref:FAD-dependent oxidoreductase n=1 Tax=Saccharopolyspora taberi TaxID=60895 RepID=A0ABN3VE11_9PSEU
MTDWRIVRHRAPEGALDAGALARRPTATVVGGGIAGLCAATGLAERGVRVVVVEQHDYLGGRVGAWSGSLPGGSRVSMSRGFHAFFRQYYNLRQLLRRADPALSRLRGLRDYPLVDARGRWESFRGLPRTPPWNALAFALRSPTFGIRDLAHVDVRAAAELVGVSVPRIYERLDHLDAESYLRRINFPDAARHLAFEVFSRSFFAEPSRMSAAELATMFHLYFLGSSEGLVFDVPDAAFDVALWSPLRKHLLALGVEFRTGTRVASVENLGEQGFRVHDSSGRSDRTDAAVLATDVRGLREIVGASPGLGTPSWRDSVQSLRSAPAFLVHRLWLSRPVAPDRPAFLATAGRPPLDNVSVLDRYEREAQSWARRNGGSVVELHAYATERDESVPARLRARLHEVYPEAESADVVGEIALWNDDCPLPGVGDFARRPRVRTPHGGLVLAGDGIRIDLPVALMERAAATGWHAANHLLARWGLAGHPLYTVPTRGRSAPLRALAGLVR